MTISTNDTDVMVRFKFGTHWISRFVAILTGCRIIQDRRMNHSIAGKTTRLRAGMTGITIGNNI